ncbi:PREDICTED: acetylcholinesterase-like [Priapulus caudatus]|uniref:Carboxylic ester hydrolase n=1 Tax=Priapulus caudatus TaxID=37621 RepID=A0ABM1DT05_PRICU|nr:PREDICTED: acetylcholinesterase-like [Priapulus caudatus]
MWTTTVCMMLALVIHGFNTAALDSRVMNTTSGIVRGFTQQVNDAPVATFLGIPYAQPPVGRLRFRRPRSVHPWKGVKEATAYGPACAQGRTDSREDCLFINVWSLVARAPPRAIMVYIHGGGFRKGDAAIDSAILASATGVVVFSMSYRLGVFGFLYLDDSEAPGNMGLLDQLLALRWIKANADRFGGDPRKITIFGSSAGAASVSYQLLSPLSRNLFRYSIMSSGSALSPWAYTRQSVAKHRGYVLANNTQCHRRVVQKITKCLRHLPATVLVTAQTKIQKTKGIIDFPFVPTVDGYFIAEPPIKLFTSGVFNISSVLMGSTRDEGTTFTIQAFKSLFPMTHNLTISRREYVAAVRKILPAASSGNISNAITGCQHGHWPYHGTSNGTSNGMELIAITGDYNFLCTVTRQGVLTARRQAVVYMYLFSYRPKIANRPSWYGVPHGAEEHFVFGGPLRSKTSSPAEKQLSFELMTYWSNFAKSGNPNYGDLETDSTRQYWPSYTTGGRYYLTLDTGAAEEYRQGPRTTQCEYWETFAPVSRNRKSYLNIP